MKYILHMILLISLISSCANGKYISLSDTQPSQASCANGSPTAFDSTDPGANNQPYCQDELDIKVK